MSNQSLQTALLQTLAFFDVMKFAPIAEECFFYLYQYDETVSFAEVEEVLSTLPRVRKIDTWYVFEGHEQLVSLRKTKELWSRQYWAKVDRWKWLCRFVPYLRKVYVCNNLSFDNVTKESDIDLFIVTAPNRLFITRIILTGLFHCFGIRRHDKKIAGRFCLSFWRDENGPEISSMKLSEDPYLFFWEKSLKLIYERKKSYEAQNDLVQKLENFLKNYQLQRIERKRLRLSDSSGIVALPTLLKLHDRDRRREIAEKWHECLISITDFEPAQSE